MFLRIWNLIRRTVWGFFEIDGEQRAAAFAFYAFFSLFPLLLLIVSMGAIFLDPATVTSVVIGTLKSYIPLESDDCTGVFAILQGVVDARRKLGIIAVIGLIWSSSHFFHALVRGVNRAWHTTELDWWKIPLKNLAMLGILASALLLGIVVPVVVSTVERAMSWELHFMPFVFQAARYSLPFLILFYGLSMLYSVSPRRKTTFREVCLASLLVTACLKILQQLLIFYAYNIWKVNVLYGAVGVLIVLLLWIYLCGVIIIVGACFCSAWAQVMRGEQLETLPGLPPEK